MPQSLHSIRALLIQLWIGLLLSCTTMPLQAADESETASERATLARLNQLLKNEQYAEAFALADRHIMDFGGEPSFDFLTGMAALKVKRFQQAVFAFERAVIVKPKWQAARFHLARAYYHIDNLAAAGKELDRLLGEVSDPAFKQTISQMRTRLSKAQLAKQRRFKQVVGLSIGHDSNINSGSTIDAFDSPLLNQPIQLSEDGKETADEVLNLSYQLHYQHPLSQKSQLIGDVALYHSDYLDSENGRFESTVAQLGGKYQTRWWQATVQLGGYFRPLLLDGDIYRNQYGLNADVTLALNRQWQLGWQLSFGQTDYHEIDTLDADDSHGALNIRYLSGYWQHQLGSSYSQSEAKNSDGEHNSHDILSLQYQLGYVLSLSQQLSFSLQWQQYNYDSEHPFFLQRRDDQLLRASLGWRYLMNDWLVWQINYQYSDKDSNLPIYQYRRNEISLGLQMQF